MSTDLNERHSKLNEQQNNEKNDKKSPWNIQSDFLNGAGEETRTPTSMTLDPKSSASANSATPAHL